MIILEVVFRNNAGAGAEQAGKNIVNKFVEVFEAVIFAPAFLEMNAV